MIIWLADTRLPHTNIAITYARRRGEIFIKYVFVVVFRIMLCTKMKLAVSALTCGPWQAARHLASLAGKVSCVQPRIWPAIQNPQMSQASILSTKQPAQLCGGHMTAFSRPVTSAVHQLLLTRYLITLRSPYVGLMLVQRLEPA